MKLIWVVVIALGAGLISNVAFGQAAKTQSVGSAKANARPIATPSPEPSDIGSGTGLSNAGNDTTGIDDGDVIKVNTELVSIPVRVMEKNGRFVGGLKLENFSVFEDGVPQEIALFANEQQPFTVALVLDMSYSSKFKISEIQSAAIAFIDQLRPQDKVMVVSFDEEVHVLCNPTSEREEIYRAIKATKIATGTSVYEAVDLVMNQKLRGITGRKAVILFSDGVDTTSRKVGMNNNLRDAMELDSLFYTIRYDTFSDVQRMMNQPAVLKQPPVQIPTSGEPSILSTIMGSGIGKPSDKGTTREEYSQADQYLQDLADNTGAMRYNADTLTNLADAYAKIASALREFYSISYYPQAGRVPGKKTSIKVKVDRPGVAVRTREGYIIPRKTRIN